MRVLHLLLALCMLAFVAVQINDDDGLSWAFYYAVPAAAAGLSALRWPGLRTASGMTLLWLGVAGWLALVVLYWPPMPQFWVAEVFMAEETAREGMGLMIAWGVLLIAALAARRSA